MAQAWTSLPDMPEERCAHTMVAILDGKKLVCTGGNGANNTTLKSVVLFDFSTQAWTSLPAMPEERWLHAMATTPDGKLVCTGGNDASGTRLKSVVMFEFSTQAWTSLPDMPEARTGHAMAATPDGKKLVCTGGYGHDSRWRTIKLKSVVMFDFSTQAWTSLPDMPEERCAHTMAATPGGKKLVCVGGRDASNTAVKSVVVFDFSTRAWTSLPDMPEERTCHTMAATPDGKKLVCTGGMDASGTILKSVVVFDFSTQAWTSLPDMPEERCAHAMAATPDGKLICVGGYDASRTYLKSVVVLDLSLSKQQLQQQNQEFLRKLEESEEEKAQLEAAAGAASQQHAHEAATLQHALDTAREELAAAQSNAAKLLLVERLTIEVIPQLFGERQMQPQHHHNHADVLAATTAINSVASECNLCINELEHALTDLHDLVTASSADPAGASVASLEPAKTRRDAALVACTDAMHAFVAASDPTSATWGQRLSELAKVASNLVSLHSQSTTASDDAVAPTASPPSPAPNLGTAAECVAAINTCRLQLLQRMAHVGDNAANNSDDDDDLASQASSFDLNAVFAAFQQRVDHEQQTILTADGLRRRCIAEGPDLAGAQAALNQARDAVVAVRDKAYDAEDEVESASKDLSDLQTKIKRAAERGRPAPTGLDAAKAKLAAANRAHRTVTKERDSALAQMTLLVHHFPELLVEFRALTDGAGAGMVVTGRFSTRTLQHFDNQVALATHPHLVEYAEFEGAPCVLKHYLVGAATSTAGAKARKQFAKEVDFLTNRLSHPLIMPIMSTFFASSTASFVVQMPWFGTMMGAGNTTPTASTLDWYVATKKPNEAAKLELISKVLQALDHVHSRGVVHRDLKPQNIFVEPTEGSHLVVGDFDASGLADSAGVSTTSRFTVEYAAPEVRAAGGGEATASSDVWSAGQVLYFCFCGGVAALESNGQSVAIAAASAAFPQVVKEAVNAMLQINPARRPPAAAAALLPCFSEVKQRLAADMDQVEEEQRRLAEEAERIEEAAAGNQAEADEVARAAVALRLQVAEAENQFDEQQQMLQQRHAEADVAARQQQAEFDRRQHDIESGQRGLAADVAAAQAQINSDRQDAKRSAARQQEELTNEKRRLAEESNRKKAELASKKRAVAAKEAKVAQEQAKLDADTAALRLKAKNLRKQVPDSWHRSGNGSLPLLFDLTHGKNWEYRKVVAMLKESLPDASSIKVERIQNPLLHRKYQAEADAIAARNPRNNKDCNETWLWHATGDTDPRLLCNLDSRGFDPTFSQLNKHGKSYGVGTYFAKHAIYSHFIFPHKISGGRVEMLVAKVALGKVKDYGSSTPGGGLVQEPEGYNSVGGTEHDMQFGHVQRDQHRTDARGEMARKLLKHGKRFGQQYVVFGRTNSYPAYLVTYKHPPT